MNRTQDRLHHALLALDREVQVTEEDLAHAQHRFVHRLAQRVRRRRSVTALAAAVAAVTLGSAMVLQNLNDPSAEPAPGDAALEQTPSTGQTSSLTADDLAGFYVMTDGNGWLWEFHADGTAGWEKPLINSSYEETEFTIEDEVLSTNGCAWRVTLTPDDTLTGVIAVEEEGASSDCHAPVGEVWEWIRISPQPELRSASRFEGLTASDPLSLSAPNISGLWWKEDGQVLLITGTDLNLDYRLDDDGHLLTAPDDVGDVVLDHPAQGDLSFLPDTQSGGSVDRGCPVSATGTMTDVSLAARRQLVWPTTVKTMTVESTPGSCSAHEDLAGVWIQVK